MAASRTSFKPGNPGRPVGSKNRIPPIAARIRVVEELGPRFVEIMRQAAFSRFKSDRRWFAERYASLLPREDSLKVEGKLESLHPLAQRFLSDEKPRMG